MIVAGPFDFTGTNFSTVIYQNLYCGQVLKWPDIYEKKLSRQVARDMKRTKGEIPCAIALHG